MMNCTMKEILLTLTVPAIPNAPAHHIIKQLHYSIFVGRGLIDFRFSSHLHLMPQIKLQAEATGIMHER